MKYSLLLMMISMCAFVIAQESVEDDRVDQEDIEHIESLIYNQAIQLESSAMLANEKFEFVANSQERYTQTILRSISITIGSSVILGLGGSSGSPGAFGAGAGGLLLAAITRISGVIEFRKNARELNSRRFRPGTGTSNVKSRTSSRNRSTYRTGQMVQIELKDGQWISGVVIEAKEWKNNEYRYRVSFSSESGKKKSKFFSEKQLRSPQ